MTKIFSKLRDLLFEPRIALIIFVFFMIGYLIILDYEGTFQEKFLHFGPSEDTKFLNMTIDTWEKVIVMYILAFATALLTNYYSTVMYDFIHSKIYNPAFTKKIDIPKKWVQAIVTLEPVMYWILGIIQFFISLTMQLQFLVPQLIGTAIIEISYGLFKVSENKFI